MTIGICDYGIGGIGLYQLLRKKTSADILYFSDSGFIPYGKVPEDKLRIRVKQVIDFLKFSGADKIAVACHAASTVIPKDNTITGIIEHSIRQVLKINPIEIGVAGGLRVIESDIYQKEFSKQGIKSLQVVAQALSVKIESGEIDSPALREDIRNIFSPLKDFHYILLACTHYPAIANRIMEFTSKSLLLDPAEEMSEWILNNWSPLNGGSSVKWFTTGDREQMKYAAFRAFNESITKIDKKDI